MIEGTSLRSCWLLLGCFQPFGCCHYLCLHERAGPRYHDEVSSFLFSEHSAGPSRALHAGCRDTSSYGTCANNESEGC